jgi:hypothetical protein
MAPRRGAIAVAAVGALALTATAGHAMSVKDYISHVAEPGRARVLRIVTHTEAYRNVAVKRDDVARCITRKFGAHHEALVALTGDLEQNKDRTDATVEGVVLEALRRHCPTSTAAVVPGPGDLTPEWTPVEVFRRQYTEVEKRYAISLASSTQAVRYLVEGRKKLAHCIAAKYILRLGREDPKALTTLVHAMNPEVPVERNIVDALAAACRRARGR